VVPYLEMVTRNGLAEVAEGTVVRYRTTAKGEEALRCMREQISGRRRMLLKEEILDGKLYCEKVRYRFVCPGV